MVRNAGIRLSTRAAAACMMAVSAAALGCHFISADTPLGAALKVVAPALALSVVPGALITLLWRSRPQSGLEVVGFGIAASFGLAHLLTILAIVIHASPGLILIGLAIAVVVMTWRVVRAPSLTVDLPVDEIILLALLIGVSVPLYLQGSPMEAYEDQVLVSVMRRLAALDAPRIDNLYVAPGIVYTYPFPGALYLMALIARLGDVDAMFVYHKLRFIWGPAALVMLYLAARSVFGRSGVACGATVTAVVFVFSGTFAAVAGFPAWWGQLVPYSYVPDVAMTVLLPALLVTAFEYVQSRTTRESSFFFAITATLILMLTMIHIREVVQFVVYMTCLVAITSLIKTFRPYLFRAVGLLLFAVLVVFMYTRWHAGVAPEVDEVVSGHRGALVSSVSNLSVRTILLGFAPDALPDFVQDFDQVFAGLMPFFLFAGPTMVLAFRERPLVWLMSLSTLTYLALMSVPVLAIPYIYLTYFEILHIPVRNVIFFVYLLAGALLYVVTIAVNRLDRTRLLGLLTGAAGGLIALLATLCLNRSLTGFFVPLIAAYGATFLFSTGVPFTRRSTLRVSIITLVAVVVLIAMWPDHRPVPRSASVRVRWTDELPDSRRVELERRFGLEDGERSSDSGEANVWGYRLMDLSRENVGALVTHPDAVDTNDIDRTTFRVAPQAPRTDHPFLGVVYVSWLQYPGVTWLIATSVVMWAVAILAPAAVATVRGSAAVASLQHALGEPFYRQAVPYTLLVIPFAFWSARPTLSPLSIMPMPPAGRVDTPRALMAQIPCVTTPQMPARFAEESIVLPERTTCPPNPSLVAWVETHVPAEAVFAVDRWTPYPPQMFMPQQAVVFPTLDATFIREDALFRDYYRLFRERVQRYRVQPFFNDVETPAERAGFVKALGVTHVLVNPPHYRALRAVLDDLPQQFTLRYDQDEWAVYEAR